MSDRPTAGGGLLLIAVSLFLGYLFAIALFAASAFVAAVLSLVCLLAFKRPIRIFRFWITPPMAKEFIARGIVGAALVPFFAEFAGFLFEFQIVPEAWFYLAVGGYALGSVGIAYWQLKLGILHDVDAVFETIPSAPQIELIREPRTQRLPEPPPEPFRFAQWDDAEDAEDGS